MDSKKLRELLEKALKAGIKRPAYTPKIFDAELERIAMRMSTEPCIEKEIIKFFESEPLLEIFNEKLFNQGNSWNRVSFITLLGWLLYYSEINGIDNALSSLENYLKIDYTPAQEILALSGIEITEPIELSKTIKLVPFSSLPSSSLKYSFDPPFLKPKNLPHISLIGTIQHIPPKAALIRDVRLSPKTVKSINLDEDRTPYIPTFQSLYEACECLTLVGNSTPIPVATWHEVNEGVPFCAGFLGGGWGGSFHDVINPSICKFSKDLSEEAIILFQKFSNLRQEVRDKLRVPILRLNQARWTSPDLVDTPKG